MKYEKLVNEILGAIGSKDNIKSVVHCATRLRFELYDESKADDEKVKSIPGVLSLVKKGGQYQLVIGNNVDLVYKDLIKIANIKGNTVSQKDDRSIVDRVLGAITGSIAPVIPLLAGCGMGKVLLLVLSLTHILSEDSQTYILINLIFDTGFAFMPAFIGFSAAKMFNTNQYMGAFLGLCLVNPSWTAIVGEGNPFTFLGIGVPLVKYTSSLVPALMAVWILSYVEKPIKKIVPEMIKVFAEPMLIALIMMPLTFIVIAPIGNYISGFVATASMFLYDHVGIAAIAILAALYPWLVSVGIHKALSPISIALVAEQGFDPVIRVVALCSNMSQAAACLAVSLKTKKKSLKSLAFSSAITAYLGGITEPALYGVNLKLKKPMYAGMIGAAIAGIFAGLVKLKAFIYVTPGILSLAMWVSKEENFVFMAIITIIIASIATFIAVFIIGFDDSEFADEDEVQIPEKNKHALNQKSAQNLTAPVSGSIVSLKDVNDHTFSSEVMGKGIAIKPTGNTIVSPCSGTISALFETGHAVGITTDDGLELLIHIGVDTVNLKGKYFKSLVTKGQKIKTNEPLIEFDSQSITQAGYDDIVIVIVTNSNDYLDVIPTNKDQVTVSDFLMGIL